MDLLPLINQAIDDVGVTPADDPEFVGFLRNAAPALAHWAAQLREQLAPETSANGSEALDENAGSPTPGTLAHDLQAGIPVFASRWF